MKNEYILDIMGLSEQYSERKLERILVYNIKDFLGEMCGKILFLWEYNIWELIEILNTLIA